jgi:hypothetical protein
MPRKQPHTPDEVCQWLDELGTPGHKLRALALELLVTARLEIGRHPATVDQALNAAPMEQRGALLDVLNLKGVLTREALEGMLKPELRPLLWREHGVAILESLPKGMVGVELHYSGDRTNNPILQELARVFNTFAAPRPEFMRNGSAQPYSVMFVGRGDCPDVGGEPQRYGKAQLTFHPPGTELRFFTGGICGTPASVNDIGKPLAALLDGSWTPGVVEKQPTCADAWGKTRIPTDLYRRPFFQPLGHNGRAWDSAPEFTTIDDLSSQKEYGQPPPAAMLMAWRGSPGVCVSGGPAMARLCALVLSNGIVDGQLTPKAAWLNHGLDTLTAEVHGGAVCMVFSVGGNPADEMPIGRREPDVGSLLTRGMTGARGHESFAVSDYQGLLTNYGSDTDLAAAAIPLVRVLDPPRTLASLRSVHQLRVLEFAVFGDHMVKQDRDWQIDWPAQVETLLGPKPQGE